MKKLFVLGIIAVMVMGMAVSAMAVDFTPNDKLLIGIKATVGGVGMSAGTFGTQADASDLYDANDKGLPSATAGSAEIISLDLPTSAGAITDGRWYVDKRSQLTGFNQIKTWNLEASLNTVPAGGNIVLSAWAISSGKIVSPDFYANLYSGSWTAAQILAGDADKSLLWSAVKDAYGTANSPQFTSEAFPTTATGSQLFTLAIGTNSVPEPGSMVALLSGLVGLVGFGIRRKK